MRRRHDVFHAEQFIVLRRFDLEHIDPGARTLPLFSAATRSASTTSPPRAQLMMRTPVFILADAPASMMLRVLSVSGRVQGNEVGAGEKLVQFDLVDTKSPRLGCPTGTDRRR